MEEKDPLLDRLIVVNIGLKEFYEAMESQEVPVVHVDWRPPAAGDEELIELLDDLL